MVLRRRPRPGRVPARRAGAARAEGPAVRHGRPPRRLRGLPLPLHRLPPGDDRRQTGVVGRAFVVVYPREPAGGARRPRHLHHSPGQPGCRLPRSAACSPCPSPCSRRRRKTRCRRAVAIGSTMDRPPSRRDAARVLLLDGAGPGAAVPRRPPRRRDRGSWWFTPGGGLDPGERRTAHGAARELFEETGLRLAPRTSSQPVHEQRDAVRVRQPALSGSTRPFFGLRSTATRSTSPGLPGGRGPAASSSTAGGPATTCAPPTSGSPRLPDDLLDRVL